MAFPALTLARVTRVLTHLPGLPLLGRRRSRLAKRFDRLNTGAASTSTDGSTAVATAAATSTSTLHTSLLPSAAVSMAFAVVARRSPTGNGTAVADAAAGTAAAASSSSSSAPAGVTPEGCAGSGSELSKKLPVRKKEVTTERKAPKKPPIR